MKVFKRKSYDCIVIGSGAGGAPFAWRLASKGLSVLIIEAGGRYDPYKDYALDSNDWERHTFPYRKKFRHAFASEQPLDKNYDHLRSWNKASGKFNRSDKRRYISYQHVMGVGGTTLHYQGEAHRLHPSAFKMKTLFGSGADWPIAYGDLEPYYTEVEGIVGVAGPKEVPGRPRSAPYPLPPHDLSYASRVVQKGASKLGLELTPNSVGILSRPYRNAPPCNYCNGCVWGCPRLDKGNVDITFIPLAEKTGKCEVVTNARVARIELTGGKDGRHRAKGVVLFDRNGKEEFVGGDFIAVACGAVETPRLLLNSEIDAGGLVGKNFMETVYHESVALHEDRLDSYRGIPIDSVIWKWNEPDRDLGFNGGLRLYPTAGSAMGPINYALRYVDGWGEEFMREVEEWFGHAVAVAGIAEFLPNKDTFVKLSATEKDEFGLPLAEIQSFLGESELKLIDFMARTSKGVLEASGAKDLVEQFSSYDFFSASHVFGTCRMGDDPSESVVGRDMRVHGIENLLITDASVFPSSGGGDAPSLTIEALSLRAADLLVQSSKKG